MVMSKHACVNVCMYVFIYIYIYIYIYMGKRHEAYVCIHTYGNPHMYAGGA
jgi:hypothetical protein